MREALKTEVLEKIADDIYTGVVNMNASSRPDKILLHGASQPNLINIMWMISNTSRKHRFVVEPGEPSSNGGYDIGKRIFKKLAFVCKEGFYHLPNDERKCIIIIKGGNLNQRVRFVNELSPIVDVFVSTEDACPEYNGNHVFDLDKYFGEN